MAIVEILETLLIGPLKLAFEIIYIIANRVVGHPGLAIIALSLAMNILVLPLYRRADAIQEQARDMDAKLQDGVAHIKKTFSGDERMMILQAYYRQNHYKPTDALNGSVSLLLEVPFFMAAYQFLSNLLLLKGVSFGPIADLGMPDGMLVIGTTAINLLPVIMTLVNVISSAIYLKGFPLKTKIQLYTMAAFFLVFLYDSPSGLVFYWTLNNVFSLVKTIFYKLKNPQKVLRISCSVLGLAALLFGTFIYTDANLRRRIFVLGMGAILQLPLLLSKMKWTMHSSMEHNKKLFHIITVFLTIFVGLLIPSTLIAASPLEFVDMNYFLHPLWYLVSSGTLAAGFFLVWARVFYWLASPAGKSWFDRIFLAFSGVALVDYMFFGTDLGVLSSDLVYDLEPYFTGSEIIINFLVVAAVAIVLFVVAGKWERKVTAVLLVSTIAMGSMVGINALKTGNAVKNANLTDGPAATEVSLELSKDGKNVVIFVMDRALANTVPFIFNERPELQEQFDGFTYFPNTVSFGTCTNFGAPPLYGGYEYTPVEMNRRDSESLESKHNESLKVMPVIFGENGYNVTICDPMYAGYQWIPDLSVFDEYPEMRTYNLEGSFSGVLDKKEQIQSRKRNFFCFSLMKAVPLAIQSNVYEGGAYNQASRAVMHISTGLSTAQGIKTGFIDSYNVLENLRGITQVQDNSENTFLIMCNNTAHEPVLLQTPDYTPQIEVDNTDYDNENAGRFVLNGETLTVENTDQMNHYHVNMAMFIQLGNWMDYLREEGVYDNTRIILVADHGRTLMMQDTGIIKLEQGTTKDINAYRPLLMVKDFGAQGFSTSEEFMTNADVPVLAFQDLIEDPVNPFTGNPINSDEKNAHAQYVFLSSLWNIEQNNGNTFLPGQWARVQDNVLDLENWEIYESETVLKEHAFPGE